MTVVLNGNGKRQGGRRHHLKQIFQILRILGFIGLVLAFWRINGPDNGL